MNISLQKLNGQDLGDSESDVSIQSFEVAYSPLISGEKKSVSCFYSASSAYTALASFPVLFNHIPH